jgi:E3 ubiquitin-protein ligase MARCH1/8
MRTRLNENICRVCLEPEFDNNVLIAPCRCIGSAKYIHEECLKTWLLSLDEDIANTYCEICSEKFSMKYDIISIFAPREV